MTVGSSLMYTKAATTATILIILKSQAWDQWKVNRPEKFIETIHSMLFRTTERFKICTTNHSLRNPSGCFDLL